VSQPFVAVAGNIGSGKSSLTAGLSGLLGWRAFYESVDDNPYLADFYRDMARWSFHLQMYFLARRFQHQQEIARSGEAVVQDRTIYEDVEIFARNLYDQGLMDGRDYATYRDLFERMVEFLRPPDLLIYLEAPVETLQERITSRGRSFENAIPLDYLARLNSLYADWIRRWDKSPLLIIDSAPLDFAHDEQALLEVAQRVQEMIGAGIEGRDDAKAS
jgi:deoxyadenosine/deoxycytidine kinase